MKKSYDGCVHSATSYINLNRTLLLRFVYYSDFYSLNDIICFSYKKKKKYIQHLFAVCGLVRLKEIRFNSYTTYCKKVC